MRQNYEYFVHRKMNGHTYEQMDRQADSSISKTHSFCKGYNESCEKHFIHLSLYQTVPRFNDAGNKPI